MMPSEINQDPVQGEFFTPNSELSERLVRESLQNSLDARLGDDPVRVRFTFSGSNDTLSADSASRYLDGLARHIRADPSADPMERQAIDAALERLRGPMTWMAVEDLGTTGLSGDIEANNPNEPDNHFWGFFRSIGISPKGEDAGGSWGLGKWVFPDASITNAYLGITRRHDEDRTLLMGVAVLRTHTINGIRHPPYGQFATSTDRRDDEWLPLPIDSTIDPAFVERAAADFDLARPQCAGLSVVVPFPKDELTPSSIARAVITQYFLPIVRGDLVVEIRASGERTRIIDSESIALEIVDTSTPVGVDAHDEESPESLAGVIRLARWANQLQNDRYITLNVPTRTNDTTDLLDLDDLRRRYELGDRLAFNLETRVQRRGSRERVPTRFRLFVERADTLPRGHDYFVRGHLSIPRMDHINRYKARALVVVDAESELAHLLRDSEGPAHISWDPHEQRLKDQWIGGYERVQEVRRAAVRLLERLVERPDEPQLDALADLFPADPADILGRTQSARRGGNPQQNQTPSPRPPALTVTRIESGFSVRAPKGRSLVGSQWTLRFAYDVVRGNAFSLFDQGVKQGVPDFSIGHGPVEVCPHSADCRQMADNMIRFRVLDEDLRLDIRGLDGRDVIVDLQRVDDSDDAATSDSLP